jgi:hypothetical protein
MHGRVGNCNAEGATPAAFRTPKTCTWFQRLSPMWPQVGPQVHALADAHPPVLPGMCDNHVVAGNSDGQIVLIGTTMTSGVIMLIPAKERLCHEFLNT